MGEEKRGEVEGEMQSEGEAESPYSLAKVSILCLKESLNHAGYSVLNLLLGLGLSTPRAEREVFNRPG